jgi:type IV pilus assembly protein PilC
MSLHLAMQAGISVSEGVSMFAQEERDAAMRDRLTGVYDALETGGQLSGALRGCGQFPEYMIDMVEAGEKTGKLDDTLLSLSRYYDRQEHISKSIRGAVTYPSMLLAVLLFVLVVFIVKVLPIFYDVYQQLGAAMSGPAELALRAGAWLGGNWLPVAAAVVVIAVLIIAFRAKVLRLLKRVFMGGALGAAMQCARFTSIMAMTMSSGMDTGESLLMASRLTDDQNVARKIAAGAELAGAGTGFAQCVEETGLLSTLYNRMLAIGVRTGCADTVMDEIAARSGDDANDRLEAFIGKIEPTLVIIMSLLVGLLLLSVMLPLAGIMSAL